jgi:putative membrane protein
MSRTAIAAALVLASGVAWAQAQTGGLALGPAELVGELHQANQIEIAAGQLAQERGSVPDVRAYGRMLESDHRDADVTLAEYAKDNNLSMDDLPERLRVEGQATRARLDNLRRLSGAEFDRAFADLMQQAHARVIGMIDASRLSVTDPRLRTILAVLEPTLHAHRQIAENLLRAAPAPSVTTSGAPCPGCAPRTAPR